MKKQSTLSSITSNHFFLIALTLVAFVCLPSFALYYGFAESTHEEVLQAMGWYGENGSIGFNISWLWFTSLFSVPLISHYLKPKGKEAQGMGELFAIIGVFAFVFISAIIAKISLGFSILVLVLVLIALATNALAKLSVLQGDKFIIASLLSIALIIFFFIVYPIISIFISMFYDGTEFVPSQVIDTIKQPYILRIITNSLSVAATIGVLATFFGLLFALYTTRIAKRTAFIGKLFSILPIVTPPFVVALGITLMLGRSGYVTEFLVEYFGFSSNWLYGFAGIVIAHTLALTPLSFMILEGALKSIHPSIEEASYTMRANRYKTFFNIIFPLLKPALANSFLVVAIQSLADFSTPLVLGGSFDVISSQIYFYIAGSQLDYASASTLGTLLLIFSLGIFVIQYMWIGNRSYVTVSGKSYRGEVQDLPKAMKSMIVFFLGFWTLFNAVLYGSIFYGSFTVNWGVDYSLTLKNYELLFGNGFDSGAWPSLIQTFLFAITAAPITSILGLLLAYITVRREFKGKKTLEFLTLLCFAVPGTVAGVAYILAFNNAPIYITGTGIIIILSMVTRNMPIGMRAAIAGLGQLDQSLDEASLSLKGSSFKTLLYVVLPLLKPALLSSLVTSFVRAMTTVSAIIFLVTADTRVATSYILNRVEDGEYGIAIAYGSVLIVVMMSIILFFDWIVGDTRIAKSKAKKQ
ncbi:ABC transporter permease [Pasteurella atlantica]|uniref:ABC transporter permease n=1 Tax=Pasteurellaceae TaxID=712 RepID=UPI00276DDD2A|nr:iron ABC transporter permease [Pasteurella atlantica]MDP8099402.1 iron ABC transporter permease [Pasteurella atlantica]MDP8107520.1 iron ABC transporter permease [Pasteurella atlantica]MDP8117211.1 iron ABC transporter permease [Pasteurella atlantica]